MPLDKPQDSKPRTKSTDNVRVIEMRKERSRNAARSRRGKENAQFDELAKLLPLPAAITSQLDKASIIRLTISYLNMREFSGAVPKRLQLTDGSEAALSSTEKSTDLAVSSSMHISAAGNEIVPFERPSTSSALPKILEETGQQLLQALDGFLMVLSMEGKILYVSETVSINLGLSQVELTGNNVFNYVHAEDHPDLLEQLTNACNSDETVDNQFPDPQGFFQCQQNQHGSSLFNQGEEIGPPKILAHQPRSFFLRMKCTLVRRGGSYAKSAGFKVVHCVGRVKSYASDDTEIARKAFVVLAQPVPTMNINELPLECNMFVSRVNMDLKIVYCEGRIHKFMDYLAKDIVGISAYDFYHAGDVALIQGHHAKFLAKGQVWTKYYRWMNKNGGWVWMQTKASLIPHPSNPGLKQMLCLNYILSDVEHRSVVLGMAQLKDKPELTSASNVLTEVPCEADNTGELNDALIDDQVMVFPKWQATSDKLVPPQTLLDQMALQRTGYTAQFNEAFKDWSNQHQWSERTQSQSDSTEPEIDDKDLEDIAAIISADVTPFDQTLFDFVVSGKTGSTLEVPSSHLGPIGAYIEEIPESSTIVVSTSSVVPKVETSSLGNEFTSTMSCSQTGRNVQRKRPVAANGYNDVSSTADSGIPPKTARLSHMQGGVAVTSTSVDSSKMLNPLCVSSNTTTPYQNSTSTWSSSTTPQMPGRYRGSGQIISSTSTITKVGSNFYPGMVQEIGSGVSSSTGSAVSPSQSKIKSLSSRKPKTLLEQLVMMPNTGKDDDLLNDDLMLELVEELLDKSGDDEILGDVQEYGSSFVGVDTNTFVPQIKQEVVTPTATDTPNPFSDCFQTKSSSEQQQQQFATPFQGNQSNSYQVDAQRRSTLRNQNNNIQGQDMYTFTQDRSSANLRLPMQSPPPPQQQQQQWQQQTQRIQRTWQQQQQQSVQQVQQQQPQQQQNRQSFQQYQQQMPKTQGSVQQQTTSLAFPQKQNLQSLPQKQQSLPQYNYIQPQQQQTQQRPSQTLSERDRIFRDLRNLIQKNNSMQASQNFANQETLRISAGPLPELGNVLDEELTSLSSTQQSNTNTTNKQKCNGTVPGTGVNPNFSGMM